MARVDMSVVVNGSAARVWDLIGGFDALPRWLPPVETSRADKEGGRTLRRLGLRGGGEVVEALEGHDDKKRSYAYTIVSGPLPVADYHAEIAVSESGPNGCTVRWSSRFEPKGASEDEATKVIRGVYQSGFDALTARFKG